MLSSATSMASSARLHSFAANPKAGLSLTIVGRPNPVPAVPISAFGTWAGDCPSKCGAHTGTSMLRPRDQSTDPRPLPARFHIIKTKAARNDRNTKKNSMICGDCDGNGAVLCSQCKGSGVNSEDVFNGRFKAGDSCWLCGGRKEMLCGNCNGAGFIGGFMSTYDE